MHITKHVYYTMDFSNGLKRFQYVEKKCNGEFTQPTRRKCWHPKILQNHGYLKLVHFIEAKVGSLCNSIFEHL